MNDKTQLTLEEQQFLVTLGAMVLHMASRLSPSPEENTSGFRARFDQAFADLRICTVNLSSGLERNGGFNAIGARISERLGG